MASSGDSSVSPQGPAGLTCASPSDELSASLAASLPSVQEKSVGEKIQDFYCNTCEKEFSQKSTLKRHIKAVHDKIQDHECSQCGKCFSDKANLKKHLHMYKNFKKALSTTKNLRKLLGAGYESDQEIHRPILGYPLRPGSSCRPGTSNDY